ncbi:hypothetical protein PIB30_057492, partial [Stylosanthes scabra]|nr:hypothetical protein [Stylosanthes scabra]
VTDQNLDECLRVFPLEESPVARRTLLRTLGSHPLVIPRAGYHHEEELDKKRKIGDFPSYLFILLLILLLHNSRGSKTTLMKTSPPTVRIPDVPGSTVLRLSSDSTPEEPAECARQLSQTRLMKKFLCL